MNTSLFHRLPSRLLALLCASALCASAPVLAHQSQEYRDGLDAGAGDPVHDQDFPLEFGGEFKLIDHDGRQVTNRDFVGRYMLVYFGYVNCKIMCSTTLKHIGVALDELDDRLQELAPVVITVDPERDTPLAMKARLAKYHPALTGLTGTPTELSRAYDAYRVSPHIVGPDQDGDPIVSHSSYIYLMGPEGEFRTLFPPIIKPSVMAQIVRKYMDE